MGGGQSIPFSPASLAQSAIPVNAQSQLPSTKPAIQSVAQPNQVQIANRNYGGNFIPGFPNPALIPYGLWYNMSGVQTSGQVLATPANFNNIFANASKIGLSPSYLKWKKSADYGDYVDARKYFAWKEACRGQPQNWESYDQWKGQVWNSVQQNAFSNDF